MQSELRKRVFKTEILDMLDLLMEEVKVMNSGVRGCGISRPVT